MDKKEYNKQYYAKNKDKILEHYSENREKILEYRKQYYAKNREKMLEYNKEYHKTPMGRAHYLLKAYNAIDKKKGRGKGNLTAKWIVDNIFSQPCAHCGKSGWEIIGCNRLDNSKPHSIDNVEPCCWKCNHRLAIEDEVSFKEQKKQVFQYTLDGELVRVWESTREAGRNGYTQTSISDCCNGKLNTHKGYKWSFNPL